MAFWPVVGKIRENEAANGEVQAFFSLRMPIWRCLILR